MKAANSPQYSCTKPRAPLGKGPAESQPGRSHMAQGICPSHIRPSESETSDARRICRERALEGAGSGGLIRKQSFGLGRTRAG